MHHTELGGVSQTRPPAGQSGDIDADGQILDELRRRLDADDVESFLNEVDRGLGEAVDGLTRGLDKAVERVRALRPRVATKARQP